MTVAFPEKPHNKQIHAMDTKGKAVRAILYKKFWYKS